jgi:hypothetical protein
VSGRRSDGARALSGPSSKLIAIAKHAPGNTCADQPDWSDPSSDHKP